MAEDRKTANLSGNCRHTSYFFLPYSNSASLGGDAAIGATAALGPFGVVQIGSSPWVNGFITLVFVAFGLSLLGAFELTLPSGLLTKVNQASERGGTAGTLLMGLATGDSRFGLAGAHSAHLPPGRGCEH